VTEYDLQHLASSLLDAMNAADWERCTQLLTPDAVYEEMGTGRQVDTDVIAAFQEWRRMIPDVVGSFSTLAIDEERAIIASEIMWIGTYTHGRSVKTTAAFFIVTVGGLASHIRHYINGGACTGP
jgi:hypothetical protein